MNIAFLILLIAVCSVASFLFGSRQGKIKTPAPQVWLEDDKDHFDATGKIAVVVDPITYRNNGRVRFQGTTWPAKCIGKPHRVEDHVVITGLDNITLIVREPGTEANS